MENYHNSMSLFYQVAAHLLLPPPFSSLETELARIRDSTERSLELLEEYKTQCDTLYNNLEGLVRELVLVETDLDKLNGLLNDITVTLYSGYKHVPCPPYESIYRIKSKHKMISIPSITDDLRKYYSMLGVEVETGGGIFEDHISVELEFLSYLHAHRKVNIIKEFISKHPMQWFPEIKKCVLDKTDNIILIYLFNLINNAIECDIKIL